MSILDSLRIGKETPSELDRAFYDFASLLDKVVAETNKPIVIQDINFIIELVNKTLLKIKEDDIREIKQLMERLQYKLEEFKQEKESCQ